MRKRETFNMLTSAHSRYNRNTSLKRGGYRRRKCTAMSRAERAGSVFANLTGALGEQQRNIATADATEPMNIASKNDIQRIWKTSQSWWISTSVESIWCRTINVQQTNAWNDSASTTCLLNQQHWVILRSILHSSDISMFILCFISLVYYIPG